VSVKNALGHFEKCDSLSPRFVLSFNWLDYYPEDNLRDHRLQFLNQDLVTLLRLKHHLFWSQVVCDSTFTGFLDSFLLFARRLGTTRSTQFSSSNIAGAELSPDPALLSPSHKSLMRNVFSVIARMATARESSTCGFGSAQAHGDLVFGVLDFPRLMDFVSLFARFNLPAITGIVSHLFSIQSKYALGLSQSITAGNQVLREMARQLSLSMQAALVATSAQAKPNSENSTSTSPTPSSTENSVDSMKLTCEDLASYYIDLVYSLSTFAKVYPETSAHLAQSEAVALLSYSLRAVLPNLLLAFEDQGVPVDCLKRHFASRNHTLSIINKVISSFIPEIQTLLDENTTEASITKSDLFKRLEILIDHVQALIIPDRDLVTRIAKSQEDLRALAWLLLEDELQQQQQQQKQQQQHGVDSTALKSSTGLSHTVVSPETFVIIRDLESKYALCSSVEHLFNSLKAAPLQHKFRSQMTVLETTLGELKIILEKTPVTSAKSSVYGATSAGKQLESQWQEAMRRCASVKEIFGDLSDGFIILALMSHYKNDNDRLIHDLLEHNLPPALSSLGGKKLSIEEARKRVFGAEGVSDTRDVFEEEGRFKMDLSNVSFGKGGSKQHGGSGRNAKVSFQEALKVADPQAAAQVIKKYDELHERADYERTYQTQLKRSRGQHVDEEDEELFERLRASAELRSRAMAVASYEDEPDDSLDDFHPVGALADDDNDSKLRNARRNLVLTKNRNPTLESPSSRSYGVGGGAYGRSYSQRVDSDEEDEEMARAFEEDDAALLPDIKPAQNQQSHQQQASNGQSRSGHGGQQQQKERRGDRGGQQPQQKHPQNQQKKTSSTNPQHGNRGNAKHSGASSSSAALSAATSASEYTPSSASSSHASGQASQGSGAGRGAKKSSSSNAPHQGSVGRGKPQQQKPSGGQGGGKGR
jgi:hypothetical protein